MNTRPVRRGMPPELASAILALGFAVDDTAARYWLAQCARRGAEQPLLDQLWATWAAANTPQTITSTPTRKDHP